jgi:hypothetical protein
MDEKEQRIAAPALTEGYTAGQAAEIMTQNSGRPVAPDLVKKLGQKGVIRSIKVNSRLNLYNRDDVDNYRVEERGKKAGRAARARAKSDEQAA